MDSKLIHAEMEGMAAYKDGVKVGDNPYPETDETHWHWMQGWATAGMDDVEEKRMLAEKGK